MTDKIEEKEYEPYDDRYFTMTREQLIRIDMASLFSGYPYEAPFFGFGLVDGHPHPYAESQIREWEKKHGPLPPITIIEDGSKREDFGYF